MADPPEQPDPQAGRPEPPGTDAAAELARLRDERDRLAARVESLEHRTERRGRARRAVVVALVVITCLTLVVSVVGIWARRNFADTDRFVDRAGSLIEDPDVQQVVTTRVTGEVMTLVDPQALFEEALPERGRILAAPLASAVEGFVRDRVERFVASDTFERLWVDALRVAHRSAVRVLRGESDVVTAGDGQITLNLVPVINEVLARLTATSPEILGRQVDLPDVTVDDVPQAAIDRVESALGVDLGSDFGQITVYDDGKLEAAQQGVELARRLLILVVVVCLVSAALALWLSRRRRRTLLQLAAGVAVGMVLVRRVVFRVDDEVSGLPPTSEGRRAASTVLHEFLDPLTTFAMWSLAAAGVVAAVAVLTGDYPWAVALRGRAGGLWRWTVAATGERARDEATVAWIAQHRDALLVAGAVVALAVLWVADLSWIALLVFLALVAAYEVAVYRIGSGGPAGGEGQVPSGQGQVSSSARR